MTTSPQSLPTPLEKALREGDVDAVVAFSRTKSEAERKALSAGILQWEDIIRRNAAAQWDSKARESLGRHEILENWYELAPAASVAVMATASLTAIRNLHLSVSSVNPLIEVLRVRRPEWLQNYVDHLCEAPLNRAPLHEWWRLVRGLIRAGVCLAPTHPNYALGALEGMFAGYARSDDRPPPLEEMLLEHRDWLDTAFWQLFEFDGTSEVSLANVEKYGYGGSAWLPAIINLSNSGVLSRDRLLDASLAALQRDFIQYRAGWFSRFHEAMRPTSAEMAARLDMYLRLLGSSIPPTVTFALKAVQEVDKWTQIPSARLAAALPSALLAKSKATARGALRLLERAALREPVFAYEAARMAVNGLLQTDTEVQSAALDLILQFANRDDTALHAALSEIEDSVKPSLRKRLADSFPRNMAASTDHRSGLPAENAATPLKSITPIASFDELLDRAAYTVENPEDADEIERVLDGVSRLGANPGFDFTKRTAPLMKRCQRLLAINPNTGRVSGRLYLSFLLAWTTGERDNVLKRYPYDPFFRFAHGRLCEILERVLRGNPMSLLSAPTLPRGWIGHTALLQRMEAWEEAKEPPGIYDQVQALLRLRRENDQTVPPGGQAEFSDAVRYALGEAGIQIGTTAPLWLAAARTRAPFADCPEVDLVHPNAGPDGAVAATYAWSIHVLQDRDYGFKWPRLELAVSPDPPTPVPDTHLSVAMHEKFTAEAEPVFLMDYFMPGTADWKWHATFVPSLRDGLMQRILVALLSTVSSAEAPDRHLRAPLELLADPCTPLRPMACLALSCALGSKDPGCALHAVEALIASVNDGRFSVEAVGAPMSRLLGMPGLSLKRWAGGLEQVAQVSQQHGKAVARLLQRTLRGDAENAPADLHALLGLLVEVLTMAGLSALEDADAIVYLGRLTTGGKTGKQAQALLALRPG